MLLFGNNFFSLKFNDCCVRNTLSRLALKTAAIVYTELIVISIAKVFSIKIL